MNTKQKLGKFYEVLEGTALEVFKKKKQYNDTNDMVESNKPKNKIPKRVRQLMKRKTKLSKRILSSKQWWKTYVVVEEIELIEKELEKEYTKMNIKAENIAIQKLKKDPKYFYNYAKKKLDGVAPLMTDPPPISSTNLFEKKKIKKNKKNKKKK